jgi:hypothetical protein
MNNYKKGGCMPTITVTPAYGRDYKSKAAALADWEADKDFILEDPTSPWYGKPCNKSALESAMPRAFVRIRYNKKTRVAFVE